MWVVLYTDVVMWLLAALLLGTAWYVSRVPDLRAKWKAVFLRPAAQASAAVLLVRSAWARSNGCKSRVQEVAPST